MAIKSDFNVTQRDAGEFAKFNAGPMSAELEWYYIEQLGNLAIMRAKAMGGMMVMDTVVLNPVERDLPLLSIDAISAMGKNTLLIELYDTMLDAAGFDTTELDAAKRSIADLPEYDVGKHWYDDLRLPCSIAKRTKSSFKPQLENAVADMLKAYLKQAKAAVQLSEDEQKSKCAKAVEYVNGLIANGGPATDAFSKTFGAERAEKFIRDVLFSTTRP